VSVVRRIAAALVHHPVLDREGAVVTTAITNLDLHDLSRSARAFGLDALYVTHPIEAQRALVTRVREHWLEGSGGKRIPDRRAAMEILHVVSGLDDALAHHGRGEAVELWTTGAARGTGLDYTEARAALRREGRPVVIAFGTGWGLGPGVTERPRVRLAAITGAAADGWNHLSVRAAAAITFDRLMSD
jgi:hypothetical protein